MLLGLSWILVATRMIMRLLNQQKHLLASDALLIISAIFALALVVTDTMTYRLGGMDADAQLTDSTLIKLAKVMSLFPRCIATFLIEHIDCIRWQLLLRYLHLLPQVFNPRIICKSDPAYDAAATGSPLDCEWIRYRLLLNNLPRGYVLVRSQRRIQLVFGRRDLQCLRFCTLIPLRLVTQFPI